MNKSGFKLDKFYIPHAREEDKPAGFTFAGRLVLTATPH